MSLVETIKILKPAERFKAFLLIAILPIVTSLMTSYLNTDDCKGISTQYESVVNNHTNLMEVNNKIINDNNSKTEAIRRLDSILVAFSQQKAVVNTRIERIAEHKKIEYIEPEAGDGSVAMSRMEVRPEPTVVVVKSTTVTDLNKKQKDLVQCALKITNEYKDN
jgi:hypothetical protein